MRVLTSLFLIKINLSILLFITRLITGTLITIRSRTWLIIWIGLEMNLISFIPLINSNKTPYEREASIKYFIVQAIASIILLISLILSEFIIFDRQIIYLIFLVSIFIKIGAAPFHIWFPGVIQGLSWFNCILLITWQKIAPIVITSYILTTGILRNIIILIRVIVGAVGGFNQTSIRKIIAYSSIRHIGWIIIAILIRSRYWIIYFIFYSVLRITVVILINNNSLFYLSQIFSIKIESNIKFSLFITILSLGGLPPFLGFMPKWIIIQNCIYFESKILIIIIIITTIITLYFYLRITYRAFTINNQAVAWINQNNNKSIIFISLLISIIGIPIIVIINLY